MTESAQEAADFEFIIALVYERSRIRLHDGKQSLIRARLGKRVRHLQFKTLGEYCDYLRNTGDEEEITHLVDALTTNFTNFLREEDHFQFLVREGLPSVLPSGQRRFNVWSAACSTGEEPYSLALYLAEHYPLLEGWDWRIFATDISTKALAKAERGVYDQDRLDPVPQAWLRKHFQRGLGEWEGHCRVKPSLAERVRFQQLNLLGRYAFKGTFEIIFCRNVMIYFDRQTQEQLVNQLAQRLAPKGYLIIGHSESVTGLKVPFTCLRPSIYQKN